MESVNTACLCLEKCAKAAFERKAASAPNALDDAEEEKADSMRNVNHVNNVSNAGRDTRANSGTLPDPHMPDDLKRVISGFLGLEPDPEAGLGCYTE